MKRTSHLLTLFPAIISALVMISVLSAGCAKKTVEPEPQPEMTVLTDIQYIEGDTSARHRLDVYVPATTRPGKVLFFIPGGAWRQGDKNKYGELATTFCRYYNYMVVVTNYRLSDTALGNAVHPDHIRDVAAAFAWTYSHVAGYRGHEDSIFVFGQSAGAHLAALLASDPQYLAAEGTSTDKIRGVILMSGVYDLNRLVKWPLNPLDLTAMDVLMYKAMVVNAFGSLDSSALKLASPANYVSAGLPPALIIRTDDDMPGFMKESDLFFNQLNNLSSAVNMQGLTRADYSDSTWQLATQMAAAEPALAEYIGHYAEVVAINGPDRNQAPTTWITEFIRQH